MIITPSLKVLLEQTGYKTYESLQFLHYLVANIVPGHVLELGTGCGCSAIFMALANKTTKITSIDNYKMDDKFKDPMKAVRNIVAFEMQDRIQLTEGDTKNYFLDPNTRKNPFEIVFMDASHNKKDLEDECKAFRHVLTDDHIIVVDDYSSVNDFSATDGTTAEFVTELSLQYKETKIVNFHNGMAILYTSVDKYMKKINDAIWSANHA
jgi:predicted O-methyltransferase YrrM